MNVRLQRQPFHHPSERNVRLLGFGLISFGVGVLAIWDPLTRPGPTVCLLRHAVGLPCPMCGMTRGVALCLRGQPIEASRFNPLAAPVLLIAVGLAVKWAIEYGTRRRIDAIVPVPLFRVLVLVGYVLLLTSWIYLLVYRREDPFVTTWLGHLWAWLTR